MAIVGKTWAGIWRRDRQPDGTFQTVLEYKTGLTPEGILGYYPELAADVYYDFGSISMQPLRARYVTQNDPPFVAYVSDEEAMLDPYWYVGQVDHLNQNGAIYLRWTDGVWHDYLNDPANLYQGKPDDVWGSFPDAPTLTPTLSDTPFGPYGNGKIKYQAVFRSGTSITAPWPDPPEPIPSYGDGVYGVDYSDIIFFFMPTYDGEGEGETPFVPEDGAGDGLNDESVRLRVWGFSLDGHDYYVLRMGPSASLIYDLTTNTWSEWRSPGRHNWRAHVGQNWLGMPLESFEDSTVVTEIVAGDDASNVLWTIDPTSGRDDRFDTGSDYFQRVVTGGIRISGRDTVPAGALTLDLAVGAPTQTGASLTLEISDDLGHNWINCGTVETEALNYDTVVEWRGLGTIKAPGRIFRISDTGASVRINAANMR